MIMQNDITATQAEIARVKSFLEIWSRAMAEQEQEDEQQPEPDWDADQNCFDNE